MELLEVFVVVSELQEAVRRSHRSHTEAFTRAAQRQQQFSPHQRQQVKIGWVKHSSNSGDGQDSCASQEGEQHRHAGWNSCCGLRGLLSVPLWENCLVQVSAGETCYVFDMLLQAPDIVKELRSLMENSSVVKVIHDCRQDPAALFYQLQIGLLMCSTLRLLMAWLLSGMACWTFSSKTNIAAADSYRARAKLPTNVDLEMSFPLVDGVQSYKSNFAVEEDNHDNQDEKLPDSQGVQGSDQLDYASVMTMLDLLPYNVGYAVAEIFMHRRRSKLVVIVADADRDVIIRLSKAPTRSLWSKMSTKDVWGTLFTQTTGWD
ncbi:hypothetical protein WJX82_005079 [Trebouxia sp. C0006]